MYDKYNSDIACTLRDSDKLYNNSIAYQIFEIGFGSGCQCLKIDFEDFNQIVAILNASYWFCRHAYFLLMVCALLHHVCSTLSQLTYFSVKNNNKQ